MDGSWDMWRFIVKNHTDIITKLNLTMTCKTLYKMYTLFERIILVGYGGFRYIPKKNGYKVLKSIEPQPERIIDDYTQCGDCMEMVKRRNLKSHQFSGCPKFTNKVDLELCIHCVTMFEPMPMKSHKCWEIKKIEQCKRCKLFYRKNHFCMAYPHDECKKCSRPMLSYHIHRTIFCESCKVLQKRTARALCFFCCLDKCVNCGPQQCIGCKEWYENGDVHLCKLLDDRLYTKYYQHGALTVRYPFKNNTIRIGYTFIIMVDSNLSIPPIRRILERNHYIRKCVVLVKEDEVFRIYAKTIHVGALFIHQSFDLTKQCNWCYTTIKIRMACSICKLIHYCNEECQKNDWPEHKKICSRKRVTNF